MDDSSLDYLKRVTDEIRESRKNSEAESTARMDRFDEWLAKSSAEFDQRIRENNEQLRKSREEFDRDLIRFQSVHRRGGYIGRGAGRTGPPG